MEERLAVVHLRLRLRRAARRAVAGALGRRRLHRREDHRAAVRRLELARRLGQDLHLVRELAGGVGGAVALHLGDGLDVGRQREAAEELRVLDRVEEEAGVRLDDGRRHHRGGDRHRHDGLALDQVRLEHAGVGAAERLRHRELSVDRRHAGEAPVAEEALVALLALHREHRRHLLGALGARDDLDALRLEVRLERRRHHAAVPRAEAQRARRAVRVERAERVRHLRERVVRHRVVGLARVAVEARERREDDEVAERLALRRRERRQDVGEAGDLDAEDRVEVVDRLVLDHLVAEDARRVDDARDREAVLRLRLLHRRLHLRAVGRVAREVDRAAAALRDRRERLGHVADAAHHADRRVERLRRRLRAAARRELGLEEGERRRVERRLAGAGVGDALRPRGLLLERRAAEEEVGAAADAAGERGEAQRRDAARAARHEEDVVLRHRRAAARVDGGVEELLRERRVALAGGVVADLAHRDVGALQLGDDGGGAVGRREAVAEVDAARVDVVPLEVERLAQPLTRQRRAAT